MPSANLICVAKWYRNKLNSGNKGISMNKNIIKGIVAASVLAFTTVASAVPTMTISDGINPVITIVDGGAGDSNLGTAGVVGYNGSVGLWNLVVSIGQTKPFLGSAEAPHMDLNYVVTSTGAGTITIKWSDTDFTAGSAGFAAEIGGTTAGSVQFSTYADAGNTLFGTGIQLTSQSFNSSPFSGTASHGAVGDNSFSLTEVLVITHGSGTTSDSGDASLATVPDGGATVTLLGTALAGLGLMGSFFKRR